jgi:signal transduction histidine kinase/DNA-binding response OmpR family regulator
LGYKTPRPWRARRLSLRLFLPLLKPKVVSNDRCFIIIFDQTPFMIRIRITIWLCIFTGAPAFGQDEKPVNIDSLQRLVQLKSTPDTTKVKVLTTLGLELISVQDDCALLYLTRARELAKEIDFHFGEAIAFNYLGRYYGAKGEYFKAMDFFIKAIQVPGDYKGAKKATAVTYYDIGSLYATMSSRSPSKELNRKRVQYFRKSLALLDKIPAFEDREEFFMGIYMELGRAYNRLLPGEERDSTARQLDSAEYYFEKALAVALKSKSGYFTASLFNDLAHVSFLKNDISKAIDLEKQAIQVSGSNDFVRSIANVSIARFYLRLGKLDSARFFLGRAVHLDSGFVQSQYFDVMGEIYHQEGNSIKAIESYQALLAIAKRNQSLMDIEVATSNLTAEYERIGNYKSALKYQRIAHESDSVYNQDMYLKMQELQAQSDLSHQQIQIDLLSKEGQLKNITIERNRTVQLLIGGILLLALAGMATVAVQYRAIRKSKQDQERAFREVDQMKSRFFANISHEFRTPLTLILAPLEKRLSQSLSSADDKKEFHVMHKSATTLLNLVNELLDLSRLESGALKLHASWYDLSELVTAVASQFTSIAESKKIRFITNVNPNTFAWVDKDKFEKILTNLISNAFKFTPDQGTISITLQALQSTDFFKAGFVEITVTDTGIGISSVHQKKIFDRFYQADNSPTRSHEGSGIGLALSKELVQLHRGKIHVESEFGKGSKFIVQLPSGSGHLAQDEILTGYSVPKPDFYNSTEEVQLNSETKEDVSECILIIEDNPDLRQYLKKEFNVAYHVIEAEDGEHGINLAREFLPTLIISDLMMPKRDGLEVCETLKNDPLTSHIPIILLTAKADVETKLQGYRKGADEYLPKPFKPLELMARIDNIIQNRKLLQEKFTRQMVLKPREIKIDSLDEAFMNQAMTVIENHIEDASFSVTVFSKETGMSPAQLYRKLHALTGFSPNDFVRHIRLLRALELLTRKAGNVADVAYKVGFNNLSYFSKVYKEKFGISPSEQLKKDS